MAKVDPKLVQTAQLKTAAKTTAAIKVEITTTTKTQTPTQIVEDFLSKKLSEKDANSALKKLGVNVDITMISNTKLPSKADLARLIDMIKIATQSAKKFGDKESLTRFTNILDALNCMQDVNASKLTNFEKITKFSEIAGDYKLQAENLMKDLERLEKEAAKTKDEKVNEQYKKAKNLLNNVNSGKISQSELVQQANVLLIDDFDGGNNAPSEPPCKVVPLIVIAAALILGPTIAGGTAALAITAADRAHDNTNANCTFVEQGGGDACKANPIDGCPNGARYGYWRKNDKCQ